MLNYPKEFNKLSKDKKYDLVDGVHNNDGKKLMNDSSKANQANKRKGSCSSKEGDKKPKGGGNWKKKTKQAMMITNGLKTVVLMLSEEDKTNKALIGPFQSNKITNPQITVFKAPAPAQPLIGYLQAQFLDTSVELQIILQNNKK